MHNCLKKPEEGVGFPEAGVTQHCEPPVVGAGNSDPLTEGLLSIKLSL